MGIIIAILSYVTKISKNLTSLMQKDTSPNYDADLDSNEAIRDALDVVNGTVNNNNALIQEARSDIASLNDISPAEVLNEAKDALDTTIPGTNNVNSVWDILYDQLRPRLPGSGTLSTLSSTDAINAAKDALNYPIPANNNGSVWDILKDQLQPRLPSSGTIATTSDVDDDLEELNQELDQRKTAKGITQSTDETSWTNIINITDKGVLTGIYQNVLKPEGSDLNFYYGMIHVIIDGQTVINNNRFSIHRKTVFAISGSLAFNHRFNTSLQVKHCVSDSDSTVYTSVSYTTD